MTLVVRATSRQAGLFETWRQSVEAFWPVLSWPVVVVLDAESAEDAAWARTLPKWLEVKYAGLLSRARVGGRGSEVT